MKLIVCLIVLSLISTYWSTGFAGPEASTEPEGQMGCSSPIAPEQLQRDHPLIPPWWDWDMQVEKVCRSWRRRRPFGKLRAGSKVRRWRKHKPGRLERLLRRFRRWRRRWRRLRRQWQALMGGTVQGEPLLPTDQLRAWRKQTPPLFQAKQENRSLLPQFQRLRSWTRSILHPDEGQGVGAPFPRRTSVVRGKSARPTASSETILCTTSSETAPTPRSTERSGRCTSARCVGTHFPKQRVHPSSASRHRRKRSASRCRNWQKDWVFGLSRALEGWSLTRC